MASTVLYQRVAAVFHHEISSQDLLAVEIACWAIGALFGIASLFIKVVEAGQTTQGHKESQDWYGRKWRTISNTGLLELPRVVIIWLLKSVRSYKLQLVKLPETLGPFVFMFISVMPLLGLLGTWIAFGRLSALAASPVLFAYVIPHFWPSGGSSSFTDRGAVAHTLLLLVSWFLTCFVWISAVLNLSIPYATLLTLLLFPVYGTMFSLPMVWLIVEIKQRSSKSKWLLNEEMWIVTGVSMGVSVAVTHIALFLGHIAAPSAYLPQTLQMMLSNILCDSLSVLGTLAILRSAVGSTRFVAIPAAVLIAAAAAGVLGGASLWLGVAGGSHGLSFRQVANVMIGLAPDGTRFELGPMFWAVHTTLIPTLVYLTLVVLCWIGKLIILPVSHFLFKAKEVEKPHNLSVAVLGLMAAIFVALSQLVKYLRQ